MTYSIYFATFTLQKHFYRYFIGWKSWELRPIKRVVKKADIRSESGNLHMEPFIGAEVICFASLLYETNIGINLFTVLGLVGKRPGPKPVIYHHILPLM